MGTLLCKCSGRRLLVQVVSREKKEENNKGDLGELDYYKILNLNNFFVLIQSVSLSITIFFFYFAFGKNSSSELFNPFSFFPMKFYLFTSCASS